MAGLFLFTACGDDDEPTHNTLLTRSYTLLNHVTDAATGNVLAVTKGSVNYKIDVTNLVGDANFGVKLDGSNETPFSLSGVKLENPSYGIYKFANATPAASITGFTGLVDFNEESTQLSFITGGKYRVCATLPEIFYTKCNTVSTYIDGTTDNHKEDRPMYQFEINPDNMTAKVIVMTFNDTKTYRYILNCTGNGANVVATPEGYTITADKLVTTTYYQQGGKVENDESITDESKKFYNIYNLNAKLDIFGNTLEASFKLGDKISVVTDGTVY